MTARTAREYERAITWNPTIAAELLGKDTPYRDEGKERCWGSFHVCRQTGLWYDFAAADGGIGSVELIQFLKKRAGEEWSFKDAVKWLVKFLAVHPGTGPLEVEDEDWTAARREAAAALARHFLDTAAPLLSDSHGGVYLASRGLFGPYPEALRWLPNARPGEGALVMPLVAFGRIVGVLLTYIDALGRKSLVLPNRKRLDIERAPGAVMVIQEPAPGVVDISATIIGTEGLENAMSAGHPEVAQPGWKIIGLPGIATLKNLPAKAGDRIIFLQDSDPEGHPAHAALQAGIDSLILQGAQVHRTEWSEHGDANAILQKQGPAELKRLLAKPAGAPLKFESEKLSIDGEIVRLAKTSLLRIVCTLVRHGKIYGRSTAAGIYRALSQVELSLCLDEVEFLRYDPHSPTMQVLDSSHHREDANILLAEPQKVGPPIARELSTWAAMALACNGQLPGALQSRSVVVLLRRALPEEAPEYLEVRSTPELVDLRRQLSAWASTVTELPLPKREEMPAEVYNRVGQNWRPIFAVGRLAGAVWDARMGNAAMESIKTETLPTLIERLLASITLAFGENPEPKTWLDSTELAARLVAQEGEQWATLNRGGAIDVYWLRKNLVGLLQPAGAQDWWETLPGGRGQRHRSGYFYAQFADAFRRHPKPKAGVYTPDDTHTEDPPKRPGVSGVSGGSPQSPKETAIFDTPDEPGASGVHRVYEKASESAADEPLTPGTPDTPSPSGGVSACVPDADDWGWADGAEPAAVEQTSAAEVEKPPEKPEAAPRPTARPRRAKLNGPAAESRPAPQLDLPEPSPAAYSEGAIADQLRQLRAANPTRSIAWIAKQSGQPRSIVREVLGNGEDVQ